MIKIPGLFLLVGTNHFYQRADPSSVRDVYLELLKNVVPIFVKNHNGFKAVIY